jgi:hypothetical protein
LSFAMSDWNVRTPFLGLVVLLGCTGAPSCDIYYLVCHNQKR